MLSSLINILDFSSQLKWLSKEKIPSEFLEHLTQTPFLDSRNEKWIYSSTNGFVAKEKPSFFPFSMVIILDLKYGARDLGLVLKYFPGAKSKCSKEYLCTYLSTSLIGNARCIPKNHILYISSDVNIFHIISIDVSKWCSTTLLCWNGNQLLQHSPLPSFGMEGRLYVASTWDIPSISNCFVV